MHLGYVWKINVLLVPSLFLLALSSLGCSSPQDSHKGPEGIPEELQPFIQAYNLLTDQYVDQDQMEQGRLTSGGIQGMLDALNDPYSAYFPAGLFELALDFSGTFDGIGAEVTKLRTGQILILSPLPESPAMKAGIKSGDLVLSVDDQSLEGMSLRPSRIINPRS